MTGLEHTHLLPAQQAISWGIMALHGTGGSATNYTKKGKSYSAEGFDLYKLQAASGTALSRAHGKRGMLLGKPQASHHPEERKEGEPLGAHITQRKGKVICCDLRTCFKIHPCFHPYPLPPQYGIQNRYQEMTCQEKNGSL